MSIDAGRGLYHCFGCGEGGDVFKFVQETQGLDFSEAVEFLAARVGITLRRDPKAAQRRGERQQLVEAVELAVEFYHDRLKTGSDAGSARAYLRSRGYDGEVVDRFKLGFSPRDGWDQLVRFLERRKVSTKTMIDAGLAARNQRGRMRDWFRGRVMFPILDTGGSPVGFGARLLEGDGPKYLNSPETRLYQKAHLLYGLNWAKAEITRSGYSLVVEGYTDVIGLHLAGVPVAVATCGTALGEEHFDLLRRFADRVVLAFDADEAGVGAALRGDELRTPTDLELDVRVAVMPSGMDPADLVQAGRVDELRRTVESSRPLLEFRIDRLIEQHDVAEAEERARAVRAVAPLIARQTDEIVRNEYARRVARRTGVTFDEVRRAVAASARDHPRRSASRGGGPVAEPQSRVAPGRAKAERELLRLLATGDTRVDPGAVDPDVFMIGEDRAAFEALQPRLAGLEGGAAPDLSDLPEAPAELLRRLILSDRPIELDPAALLRRLERWRLEDRIAELQDRIDGESPESEAYSILEEELIGLVRHKRTLEIE
jgi:DNA primase